jgi:DNA-binding CsgD family transcriptional regulator
MLQSGYMAVMQAANQDEFLAEIVRFSKQLGFQTVSATLVVDQLLGESQFITVANTPDAYRAAFQSPENWKRDPVMQHCKRKSMPLIWGQDTYTAEGAGEIWEEQALYGYRTGIAMALHLPEGKHFMLGVDRDQPVPNDPAELTRMVADLQLLTVHANEAAARILMPVAKTPGDMPALTPRELEALRWTMEGKTAWETGNILGISERTAVLHVNNAMHKLGCINKHQAVLKAIRLGILR